MKRLMQAWLALVLAVGVACGNEAPPEPEAKQAVAGAAGPAAGARDTRRSALESDGGTSGGSATPDAGASSSAPDAGSADAGSVEPEPKLTVDAPEMGAVLGSSVLVRGRVEGGAAPVKVQVQGVEVPLVAGAFSTTLSLTEEMAHTLEVRVTDARGRTASEQRTVTVDTTLPHLEVTSPATSPLQVSESPYRVEGLVGDTHLAGVSVRGVPVPVVAGGFSAAVPLGEGDNTVVVVAWDAAGNQRRVERVLKVAGLPPQVAIVAPLNGSESPGPVVKVRARVTSTASLASVRVGTGTATLLPSGEYEASVMLALGENTLKVVATDSAGLVGTASVRVRYRDVTTEALVVTGMDPLPGAVGVEPDSLISVAFNKAVRRDSLKDHFTVSAAGERLEGGYSLAPGGQTATFVAKKALPEGTRLTVEVDGVLPEEGPAMAADYTGDFTVRGPLTRVRGYITDAEQQPLPGVGVTLEGRNLSTRTGPDGNWALFVPEGGEVVVRYEGGVGSDGRPYPKLRRRLFITQGEETVDAPLALTPTDTASAQAVKVTGAVSLEFAGRHPGLLVQAPADALSFEDGKTTEFVTATWLPSHALPVPMEGRATLGGLWQVGPAGMRLSAPVTLSLPNLTAGLPVGRYALLLAYDPHRHLLVRVGFGRVAGERGEVIVTEQPVRLESLEFLAYMPLSQEQHEVVARALGTSGGGTDGGTPTDGGLGWLPRELRSPGQPWWKLALSPFMVGEAHAQALMGLFSPAVSELDKHIQNSLPGSVTGSVRAPMDRELQFTLMEPLPQNLGQQLRLEPPYELPVMFEVNLPRQSSGTTMQQETVRAKLEVRGPDGVLRAPPSGELWEVEGQSQVRVSAKVSFQQPGQTLLKLMGSTLSGTRVLEVKAELIPDTDGGTGATLKLTKGVDTTVQDEALDGPIRFKGLRVTVTGPAANGVGLTGDKGRYGIQVSVPGGSEMGISCTEVPLGPKVVERLGEDGVTHYDTVMQQFAACSPTYSVSSGSSTEADILVDARFLYGNLLFVDRTGKPLDGLCGAPENTPSERDPDKLGEYLAVAPQDVDGTEVHFFREDDLEHPIATYALAERDPAYCYTQQNPVDGGTPATHAMFSRMRLGPTHGIKRYAIARCQELDRAGQKTQADRDYYQANCQDNRTNFLSLSAGDRLVVFAINHATGYAGMKTVTVPPINRSTRTEEGRCEADEGVPPLSVDEHGQNYTLSRCTRQELGIPVGDIQMYPPEIDVRVTRKVETEGDPKVKLESLVRHGGAATTRDDFVYVSTHWRVRVKPYLEDAPSDGGTDGGTEDAGSLAVMGNCSQGRSPDGGYCAPDTLLDKGDAGLPLEVYCSELPADASPSLRKGCINGETPLAEVPKGVPPLAGRVIGVTGAAAGEPVVIRFPLKPGGRFVESVQTALRYRKVSGAVEFIQALPKANYYLHTVGHPIFPRDLNKDGFIQTAEQRIAPPGFSEQEAPTEGEQGGRVPTHAVGLKNVYRHIEPDGRKRERFDLALEHAFRVLELKDIEITAQGTSPDQDRDLKDEASPSATRDDVGYQFLAHLLEPEPMGRPGVVSGEYVMRLGGDGFGMDCPITLDAETHVMTASCGGEFLQEILSANDILYIELYLSGNAENVLYRFNFAGLAARTDLLSAGHSYTVEQAETLDDASGNPAPGREVSEPPVASFYVKPAELSVGTIHISARNADGTEDVLKEVDVVFADNTWQVTERVRDGQPVGRARAKLLPDAKPSNDFWRFQLQLPSDLASMREGSRAAPPVVFVTMTSISPKVLRRELKLGSVLGAFAGVNAEARAQATVAGVNVSDGHLSFSHTDFSVPHGPGSVGFSRTYNNQNNLVAPMGVGWSHNYEGWVLEEEYQGRYVVVVNGQAFPFPRCVPEPVPSSRAMCYPDTSHNNVLIVNAPLPAPSAPTTSAPPVLEMQSAQGWTFRFDRAAQGRDKSVRRKWLLTRYGEARKDPGTLSEAAEGSGNWVYLTYEDETDLVSEVDWRPGNVKLAFSYKNVDHPKAPARVLALSRSQGFKWLSRVELKHKPTAGKVLYRVDFDHDPTGNLLHAVRTQWEAGEQTAPQGPYPVWTYEYHPIPEGLSGPERGYAANELKAARFIHSPTEVAPPPASGEWNVPTSPVQWWATYTRATESSSAGKYRHLKAYEMVASVGMMGQQGQSVTLEYPNAMRRSVIRPDGVKVDFELNAYGSIKQTFLPIADTGSKTEWQNDESLTAQVMPKSSSSPTGLEIEIAPKPSSQTFDTLQIGEVKFKQLPPDPDAQPVAALSENDTVTLQYGNARKPGLPTATTYPAASGQVTLSTPADEQGSPLSASVSVPGGETQVLLQGAKYDDRGRPTQAEKDKQGRLVKYLHYNDQDGLGQLETMEMSLAEAVPGSALQTLTRTFAYDAYGRLKRVDDVETASFEEWTYDGLGRLRTYRRSGEPVEEWNYSYEEADNKLTTREWLTKFREDGDPSPRHERVTVVENGLKKSETYWVGSPPDGISPAAAGEPGFRQVTRSYGYTNGRLETVTDERGVTRKHVYDLNGRLQRVELAGGAVEVAYELDVEGRVRRSTDHLGRTTKIGYDKLGRAVSWDYGDDDVEGVVLDAQGSLVERWWGKTKVHRTQVTKLDALGHPLETQSMGKPGGVLFTETWDTAGRLTKRVDAVLGLEDAYEYKDVLGRLTLHTRKVKTRKSGDAADVVTVLERTEQRKYDDANHTITTTRTIQTGLTDTSTRTESEMVYVDSAGRVLKLERTFEGAGKATHEYRYNERGQVRWYKSPEAAITEYRHDPVGNLVQVRQPADSGSPGSSLKTTYLLHEDGQIWVEKGPHPGAITEYQYDDFGQLKSKKLAGYGSTPEATWVYAPTGNPGELEETAPEGVVTTRRLNARGRIAWEKVEGVGGSRETTIVFDGPAEASRTVREGTWTSTWETLEQDDLGRPLEELESWSSGELGYKYKTKTVWTGRDAIIRHAWATSSSSPLPTEDSQRNRAMEVSVDSLGNVVRRKPENVSHTEWALYDADGKLSRLQPAGHPATDFTYDQGLLRAEDYAGEITSYTYDLEGRLRNRTRPDGLSQAYEYYPRGVLKSETHGRVDGQGTGFDGAQRTEYQYDSTSGLLAKVFQGAGSPEQTEWTYVQGARGELLSVSLPAGLVGTFNYTYDGLLRLKSVDANPVMPGMSRQEFTYDFAGRVTERKRLGKTPPFEVTSWQTQYVNGEARTRPYPADPEKDGVVETVSVLDGRGRVARVRYSPPGTPYQDLFQVDYEYNGADQPLAVGESRGQGATVTNAYAYDARGLLTSVVRGADTVTYGYTASGQREWMTVSSGASLPRTVHYSYDARSRLSGIVPSDASRGSTSVTWEPGGERVRLISDNVLVQQRCYDGAGRIKAVINAPGGSSPDCDNPFGNAIAAYTYTYDGRGNRLTEEARGSSVTVPGVTRYGYDEADRITGVRYPDPDATAVLYSLGTDGTRQGEKGLTGYAGSVERPAFGQVQDQDPGLTRSWAYGYNSLGGLQSITDVKTNMPVATITTDRFGQVRREVRGAVTTDYRWDPAGRIAEVEVSDGAGGEPVKTRYTYDHAGLRRTKTSGAGAASWLYVGDELLEERLPGSTGARLIHERVGSLVTAVGGERILHDGLGSAVGRVAPSSMPKVYRVDAWGGYAGGAGPAAGEPSLGYTGHSYDADTGLTYAQQRWFNTGTGRFLSEDPVGAAAFLATPQGLNPWLYANGNPTKYTDPDGRFGLIGAGVGALVGGVGGCLYGFYGADDGGTWDACGAYAGIGATGGAVIGATAGIGYAGYVAIGGSAGLKAAAVSTVSSVWGSTIGPAVTGTTYMIRDRGMGWWNAFQVNAPHWRQFATNVVDMFDEAGALAAEQRVLVGDAAEQLLRGTKGVLSEFWGSIRFGPRTAPAGIVGDVVDDLHIPGGASHLPENPYVHFMARGSKGKSTPPAGGRRVGVAPHVAAHQGPGTPEAPEVRLYRAVQEKLQNIDPKYVADRRLVVDMPFVGKGPSANSAGWVRDRNYYWREIMRRHPEAFSPRNRAILAGKIPGVSSPTNDSTFRAVFKQYDVRGLRGETLVHHHIGGGGQAAALPYPLHKGSGDVHNVEKAIGIYGGENEMAARLAALLMGKGGGQ